MTEIDLDDLREELLQCRRCGICRNAVYEAKGFDGICPIWRNTAGFETSFMRGKIQIALALLDGQLEKTAENAESLYQCALCGNCTEICGAEFHPAHVMEIVREVLNDLPNEPRDKIAKSIDEYNNPYNEKQETRRLWLEELGLDVPTTGDVLYYVGCTAALRIQETAKNTALILDAAKTGFAVMENEPCCGSVMMRTGRMEEAKANAMKVADAIKATGAKKVIMSCSGCLKTLRKDYPEKFGIEMPEILHIVEYSKELIKEGKLKPKKIDSLKVTYHDPCHLGREMEIFEEPREILQAIPGVEFVETDPNRNAAICCGAGGGLRSYDGDLSKKIAADRVKAIEETGATTVVSACPFCETNLIAGAKLIESSIQVVDVVDLLRKSIL
ncbi:MAG: (Fe-S)-binding protein [Candidatus Thorarchaeota archaeon]|jgi:heterodisulfide reductase subunit D